MDGVINIYKPTGITSFDVVRKVRKIANTKKVGHTGTLDPEASGVLPVCIGKSTKIVDYIMNGSKTYKAEIKLGVTTDTYDNEGQIISRKDINCTEAEIIKAINSFIGEIDQIPPMYSALKVNGVKLYELARQGIEIDRKPRKINIHNITIEKINIPFISITVECSKGTYIRSLCNDIGEKLLCGAIMNSLERTKTSIFTIENSIDFDTLNEENLKSNLISIEDALLDYPKVIISKEYLKPLLNGVPINPPDLIDNLKNYNIYRVYLSDGYFLGLGNIQNNSFKIKKLLIQE